MTDSTVPTATGAATSAGTGGYCASAAGHGATSSPIDAVPRRTRSVRACGEFALSPALHLAPAAPGQQYQRCDTLGPDRGWQVSLSSDARRLAARTSAGTVRLLATEGGWREIAQLASPLGRIDAVAFSPDDTLLAVLSSEMGQVTLWRAQDGALVRMFAAPPASTIDSSGSALAFSSDGRRLAISLGTFLGEGTDPGGTIIDLVTGGMTDWRTGLPVHFALAVNPENLSLGVAIPQLRFTAGDRLLFVDTEYQLGNSPTSTRLSLRDPATGREIVLFDMYSRALSGFALSPDGRLVALGSTDEARVAGFAPGLAVYRADTGAPVAADATFTGRVLAFSPDGARLYTQTLAGDAIVVLDAADLRPMGRFAWPAGDLFQGISPHGNLVVSSAGMTAWLDPSSGAVVRTAGYALGDLTFSADGRYGAGAGGDTALFHMWRESDGGELCAPPPRGPAAPPLSALGATNPDETGEIVSADRSIGAVDTYVVHTHSSNWSATHVRERATGIERRIFGATAAVRRPLAISPTGDRLFTSEGPADVAVWCRYPSALNAVTDFTVPAYPYWIVTGSDENLWFTSSAGFNQAAIGRITTSGVATLFPLPNEGDRPAGIAAGSDGNLWFAETATNRIGRMTTTGVVAQFDVPTPASRPFGIAAGRDGNLWFVEYLGNKIGRITTAGAITEFPIPTASSGSQFITIGPDDNLWFTETAANKIGRVTPAGVMTEFDISTPASSPAGITAGPDGSVWFTEQIGNIGRITVTGTITEFPLPNPNSFPLAITAGPDGNLWFTGNSVVRRITTAGVVTELSQTSSPATEGITAGPDGNLWFAEGTGEIGRIVP
jgi:virginiamycin B lyase